MATSDAVIQSTALTYLAGLATVIILNFLFGWDLIWPILGYGVGFAIVTALAVAALASWIYTYRQARRSSSNF